MLLEENRCCCLCWPRTWSILPYIYTLHYTSRPNDKVHTKCTIHIVLLYCPYMIKYIVFYVLRVYNVFRMYNIIRTTSYNIIRSIDVFYVHIYIYVCSILCARSEYMRLLLLLLVVISYVSYRIAVVVVVVITLLSLLPLGNPRVLHPYGQRDQPLEGRKGLLCGRGTAAGSELQIGDD